MTIGAALVAQLVVALPDEVIIATSNDGFGIVDEMGVGHVI